MQTSLRRILPFVLLIGLVLTAILTIRNRPVGPTPSLVRDFPDVRFVDVTESAGIRFRHFNGATGKKLLPETMGSGVAVLDFDRDGWPDLLFVNGRPWPGKPAPLGDRPTQALYRNKRDGTFEDVSASVGLVIELFGMGVAVGDFDNDGFPDLFITAVGGNRLFRNCGGQRFEDVTARAGVGGAGGWPEVSAEEFLRWNQPIDFPSSATFLDFDADGRLDLFVCNYLTWSPAHDLGVNAVLAGGQRAYVPPQQFPGTHCSLYRNLDGTRFEDVSEPAGIWVSEGGVPVAKALGVVACDPDHDGWTDLIVANDTVRNFFFHNVPASGGGRRFEEIGLTTNVAYADGRPRGGMGIDAVELRPGHFAAVIANFTNEPNTLLTLSHNGPLLFRDTSQADGLAGPSRGPMKFGALFLDFDLDGRPDLLTANGHLEPDIARAQPGQTHTQPAQLYWNNGRDEGGRFEAVTSFQVGPDLFRPKVGRGCAALDFDRDGDLDVVLTDNNGPVQLLRNDNQTGRQSLAIELVGDSRTVNRDAVGSEIAIEIGGQMRRSFVFGARGYLSQSQAVIVVGLKESEKPGRAVIRWPGTAGIQEWPELPTSARIRLTKGQAMAEQIERR